MLKFPLVAAFALALATMAASAQESQQQPPAAQPEAQPEPGLVGMPVYSSDGQKLGDVTHAGTAGGKSAVRAEMGQFLGLGSRGVVIDSEVFQKKADRIELTMTASEVKERLESQKQSPPQ
jgi:hypothetical protein